MNVLKTKVDSINTKDLSPLHSSSFPQRGYMFTTVVMADSFYTFENIHDYNKNGAKCLMEFFWGVKTIVVYA